MCKYSIIVPIYNVEDYLDKCLNSLLLQSYQDFEVLCVNDGTKDNSQAIVDAYVLKDNRFKSFIKENGGLADARNYGVKHAIGTYILFIDSDDYAELELLSTIESSLGQHDLVIFGYSQKDLIKNTAEDILPQFEENKSYSLKTCSNLLDRIDNCAWNKCYHRSLLMGNEYPRGFLYEDLGATYIIVDQARSIGFIKKPLINYLLNRPGNITTLVGTRLLDIFEMCRLNIEYFKNNDKFDLYYSELERLCWKNIVECLRKLRLAKDKQFALNFIDMAFDFKSFYFNKRKGVNIANNLKDNIYEYRFLCKLYIKLGGKNNG